ncbi:cytochrome b/b6 domain-containing protein [Microbacterium sp. CIAB417]|uniref:cytochrome b/b6 domain-containing protein n=1 Tax=Microbacterium sp. CIAB417 TaxID=2860287 RepID=UPI001FAB4F69|nr:cytochrome b/b6 domain-containing protein [Microbacterium sp. CIAB417]
MLRRGLPRVPGGEPWPPADVLTDERVSGPETVGGDALSEAVAASDEAAVPAGEAGVPAGGVASGPQGGESGAGPEPAGPLRRGLPRLPGGEPWPPAEVVAAGSAFAGTATTPPAGVTAAGAAAAATAARATSASSPSTLPSSDAGPSGPSADTSGAGAVAAEHPASGAPASDAAGALRRGLPRVPGGEPWPPAGVVAAAPSSPGASEDSLPAASEASTTTLPSAPQRSAASTTTGTPSGVPLDTPLPFPLTVHHGAAPRHPAPAPEPQRLGPFTRAQWAGVVIVGGAGLLFAAGMAVFFVRWLLSLDGMADFVATYPGEYHLPEGAPVGFPAWLGWQHFFNVFLMVLIIRSGLRIRGEKRPTAFWTPRNDPKGKTSLTIWFHQALDVLWLLNGVVFVVLLFVTGQWMRVVPTSWEVFPNAVSAALQYVSLDWPTENGWANYNSLQQLAYFATIFLAAPLAAVTGFRMSGMWPKKAERLSKAYPIEWARAVHFPVMLYFVAFIFVHVALVLSTGALRNLNHMYAAQGSTDPTAYADNWTGFWMFVASLVVIAAAWIAARPLVIAPIARLFGTVSGR